MGRPDASGTSLVLLLILIGGLVALVGYAWISGS